MPTTVLADASYWHKDQIERIVSDGMQVLVAPDIGLGEGPRALGGRLYAFSAASSKPSTDTRSMPSASTASSRCHNHWIAPATG